MHLSFLKKYLYKCCMIVIAVKESMSLSLEADIVKAESQVEQ